MPTGLVSLKMLCGMRTPRESFKFTGLTLQSPQLVAAPAGVNHFIHVKAFSPLSTTIQWGTRVLTTLDTAGPGRLVPW